MAVAVLFFFNRFYPLNLAGMQIFGDVSTITSQFS